jgi:hypothetical protein
MGARFIGGDRDQVFLMLYAYALGNRSSGGIECACAEDVAYRVVAGNLVPDHSTIAEFRCRHEHALGGRPCSPVCWGCARGGLTSVRVVAIERHEDVGQTRRLTRTAILGRSPARSSTRRQRPTVARTSSTGTSAGTSCRSTCAPGRACEGAARGQGAPGARAGPGARRRPAPRPQQQGVRRLPAQCQRERDRRATAGQEDRAALRAGGEAPQAARPLRLGPADHAVHRRRHRPGARRRRADRVRAGGEADHRRPRALPRTRQRAPSSAPTTTSRPRPPQSPRRGRPSAPARHQRTR